MYVSGARINEDKETLNALGGDLRGDAQNRT